MFVVYKGCYIAEKFSKQGLQIMLYVFYLFTFAKEYAIQRVVHSNGIVKKMLNSILKMKQQKQ